MEIAHSRLLPFKWSSVVLLNCSGVRRGLDVIVFPFYKSEPFMRLLRCKKQRLSFFPLTYSCLKPFFLIS